MKDSILKWVGIITSMLTPLAAAGVLHGFTVQDLQSADTEVKAIVVAGTALITMLLNWIHRDAS